VPIEARMVTKAIERAQNTVEQRNAETRKDVLKYDEVMNEQRKVIYARRDQILEGADLKAAAMDYLADAVNALLETYCASPADDEWDLDGLAKELVTFWPTTVDEERLEDCRSTDQMYDLVMEDATAYYGRRETELGEPVMREVERQVMLRIIDQRWREHLEEMDYLKEGINLRAMGQKDPLTEWQREGYEMFGSMMKGIAQDFVRYVMHVQVVQEQAPPAQVTQESGPVEPGAGPAASSTSSSTAAAATPASAAPAAPAARSGKGGRGRTTPAGGDGGVRNMQTSSSSDVTGSAFQRAAAGTTTTIDEQAARQGGNRAAKQETVVKDEWSKTPRNAPCPCGSGKKFKMCHGAN